MEKCYLSTGSIIDTLLTDYITWSSCGMLSMYQYFDPVASVENRLAESMKQYFDRVASLEKRSAVTGKIFSDKDKIRNMVRGLPVQF